GDPAVQLAADHGELAGSRPRRVAAPLLLELRDGAPRPHDGRSVVLAEARAAPPPREDRLRRLRARHREASRAGGRRREPSELAPRPRDLLPLHAEAGPDPSADG